LDIAVERRYIAKKVIAVLEIFSFLAMVNWIQCCTNFNLLNLMLHFVLPSFSFFSMFQLSSTVFAFLGLNTVGSSLAFSVLFLLLCYFNILFYSWQCLLIVNSVYYANKLGYQVLELLQFKKILDYKSWFLRFWKKGKA